MRLKLNLASSIITITFIFAACSNAQNAAAAAPIRDTTALMLLDKYAETQDKLVSFKVRYEETCDREYLNTYGDNARYSGKYKTYISSECTYDKNRFKLREHSWGNINSTPDVFVPKEKAGYLNVMYDGNLWLQYFADAKNIINKHSSYISPHPRLINLRYIQTRPIGLLMGYMEGDFEERIDSILRNASSLKLREKPELINGALCYVIEGITRKGKYTVWLDPEHGYHIAQAMMQRGTGDIYYYDQPALTAKTRVESSIRDIRFEKINGIWVPMELTAKYSQIFFTGSLKYTIHHKNTELILNPDLTNAFVPDPIPDGTNLAVTESTRKVPKGSYIWKNGKPCDKQGNPLDFSE
ncbi:MAG: hypothetical protein ACE14V_15680 [bacterium]